MRENCTSGSVRGALGNQRPYRGGMSNSGGGSVNDNFFEISSARDMLGKAKRELEKMNSDLTTDTVFNFFVTAYHVMDYVKAQGKASKIEIDKMYADPDFEMCNFICNKGKHIRLKKGSSYKTIYNPGALLGAANFGEVEFAESKSYVVVDGHVKVNVLDLSERLIAKWETFFSRNGI